MVLSDVPCSRLTLYPSVYPFLLANPPCFIGKNQPSQFNWSLFKTLFRHFVLVGWEGAHGLWNSPLYIGLYEIIPQLIINLPGLPNPKLHHVPFLHFCKTTMPLGLDTPATAASPVLFHAQNLGTAAGRRLWSLSFPSSWESVAKILSNIALANPWAKIIQNPSLGL